MPYAHIIWADLQTALSQRLRDTAQTFWTATEVPLHLAEAMRTFGVLSGYWRERSTVTLVSGTFIYALESQTAGSPTLASLIGPTITDRDIIQQVQFALLESASTQASWPGTSMFTYNDVATAGPRRLTQFLDQTVCLLTPPAEVAARPPNGGEKMIGAAS